MKVPLVLFFQFVLILLDFGTAAPAVSSVHVTFVSGNKATQYSHSINSPLPSFNLLSSPTERRRRSVAGPSWKKTTRPRINPKFARTIETTTTEDFPEPTPTTLMTSTMTTHESSTGKGHVTFVTHAPSTAASTMALESQRRERKKVKESKAVKRSPYIPDNFDAGAINFPDFDDFGGEFGSLKNFDDGGGRGGGRGGPSHSNPEALSPHGVFLPPLPTEASDYADTADSDPYLGDPDTAKYAAQHPPFFAAYPHKRAVLALNEQRVHNGLEPNILRSLRPFFAFFDAAKPGIRYGHRLHHHLHYYEPPPPPPPRSYSHIHHHRQLHPNALVSYHRSIKHWNFL